MVALPRWMYQDPSIVCEQLQAMERKRAKRPPRMTIQDLFYGSDMTREESDQIEELLLIWYEWARRYRPALGAPRVSPYGRGSSGDAYGPSGDEVDARIAAEKAAAVDVCLNELTWQQRSAVGIHIANKAAGSTVYKNPRLTPEQHHSSYQEAKSTLLPMLRKRGMVRTAA